MIEREGKLINSRSILNNYFKFICNAQRSINDPLFLVYASPLLKPYLVSLISYSASSNVGATFGFLSTNYEKPILKISQTNHKSN